METLTPIESPRLRPVEPVRKFKRHNGCLIVADYLTPAADQQFGYVLEAVTS